MKDDCIFCKISNGIIPSATVYENENYRAILDISPASKGHTIIMPKRHIRNIFDMEESDTKDLYSMIRKIAIVLKEELKCDGMNILQNNEEAAGQTVFHAHIHLIPRYKDDKVKITWENSSYHENEMGELAERLLEKLS